MNKYDPELKQQYSVTLNYETIVSIPHSLSRAIGILLHKWAPENNRKVNVESLTTNVSGEAHPVVIALIVALARYDGDDAELKRALTEMVLFDRANTDPERLAWIDAQFELLAGCPFSIETIFNPINV